MYIPPVVIRKIQRNIDLVELMQNCGVIIKLPTGSRVLALCPFHDDSRASLSINRKKGLYYCFACGASGNAFSYISWKHNSRYFPDVVRIAAEIAGIDLDRELYRKEVVKKASHK